MFYLIFCCFSCGCGGEKDALLLLFVAGGICALSLSLYLSLYLSVTLSRSVCSKQQTVVAVTENCNCIYNSTAALALPRFVYATYVDVSSSLLVLVVVVPVVVYDAFGISTQPGLL